jgi:putative lipoic acid-binding regulatory protein
METIQLGAELIRDIIWEHKNKNYDLVMEYISDTDNDTYTNQYVVRRNADGRYFKFQLVHCEQLDFIHPNLNTFPLSATQVVPRTITSVVFE